jgi:hypothetical protein
MPRPRTILTVEALPPRKSPTKIFLSKRFFLEDSLSQDEIL